MFQALDLNIKLFGMPISLPKQCKTNFLYFPKGKYKKQFLHQHFKNIPKCFKIGFKTTCRPKRPLLEGYHGMGSVPILIPQRGALVGGLQRLLLGGYNGMGSVPILISQHGGALTPPM